jgi:hypothetical protein
MREVRASVALAVFGLLRPRCLQLRAAGFQPGEGDARHVVADPWTMKRTLEQRCACSAVQTPSRQLTLPALPSLRADNAGAGARHAFIQQFEKHVSEDEALRRALAPMRSVRFRVACALGPALTP